jgi:hypothetical protein
VTFVRLTIQSTQTALAADYVDIDITHVKNVRNNCCRRRVLGYSKLLLQFTTVLWINYDRSTFEGTGRHQHCIKVDSKIQLDTDVGIQIYQIGGIICHQAESSENGHYVSYIRHKGVWRLYDDSKVRLVEDEDIVTEVKSREVVMCFYIQIGSDKSCEVVRIGSDELLIGSKISTRSNKRAKLSHNNNSTA